MNNFGKILKKHTSSSLYAYCLKDLSHWT